MPPGVVAKFPFVRIIGNRALVSGHGPLNADGSLALELFGKVGADLDVEQAREAAHLTSLAVLASLVPRIPANNQVNMLMSDRSTLE